MSGTIDRAVGRAARAGVRRRRGHRRSSSRRRAPSRRSTTWSAAGPSGSGPASGPTTRRWRCAWPSRSSTVGDLDLPTSCAATCCGSATATSRRTGAASTSATPPASSSSGSAAAARPIDPAPDEEAAANGSLMRLAAVPIRWHRDVADAAERSRRVQPDHPRGRPARRRLPRARRHDGGAHRRPARRRGVRARVLAVGRAAPGGRRGRPRLVAAQGAARDPRHRLLRRRARGRDLGGRRRPTTSATPCCGPPTSATTPTPPPPSPASSPGPAGAASGIPPAGGPRSRSRERIGSLSLALHDAAVPTAGGGGRRGHDRLAARRLRARLVGRAPGCHPRRRVPRQTPSRSAPAEGRPARRRRDPHVRRPHRRPTTGSSPTRCHVDAGRRRPPARPPPPPVPDPRPRRHRRRRLRPASSAPSTRPPAAAASTSTAGAAIGRTGTVVGCLLAEGGADYQHVLDRLARHAGRDPQGGALVPRDRRAARGRGPLGHPRPGLSPPQPRRDGADSGSRKAKNITWVA